MGGRGGGSSRGGKRGGWSSDGTISEKKTVVTVGYRSWRSKQGISDSEVLEATTNGKGDLTFSRAKYGTFYNSQGEEADYNEVRSGGDFKVSYSLKAGAVDGKTFGIDWSKVRSVQGQTYAVKDAAKAAGMKWDSSSKKWIKK